MLKKTAKKLLNLCVTVLSQVMHMHFPVTFVWNQKLNMLMNRYEPDTTAFFISKIRPGMTVVDIGAHIGYFTRLFSKLVGSRGKVVAFEADPFIFELLKKNTKRLKNVDMRQLAVGDRNGSTDFYHSEEKSGCSSTVEKLPILFKKRKITVPACDLDSILESSGVKRVDLIKMDIEGGEPRALRGMQRTLEKNHDIILVTEFAPEWIRAGGMAPLKFLEELKNLGFSVYSLATGSLTLFDPKSEEEMNAATSRYSEDIVFMNIYCVRERAHFTG